MKVVHMCGGLLVDWVEGVSISADHEQKAVEGNRWSAFAEAELCHVHCRTEIFYENLKTIQNPLKSFTFVCAVHSKFLGIVQA